MEPNICQNLINNYTWREMSVTLTIEKNGYSELKCDNFPVEAPAVILLNLIIKI